MTRKGEMVAHLASEAFITAPTDFDRLADLVMAHEDYARREAFTAMKEGAWRVLVEYEGRPTPSPFPMPHRLDPKGPDRGHLESLLAEAERMLRLTRLWGGRSWESRIDDFVLRCGAEGIGAARPESTVDDGARAQESGQAQEPEPKG